MSVGPLFEARYGGFCASCDDEFEPGDLIAGSDDGWLCELCAADWRREELGEFLS